MGFFFMQTGYNAKFHIVMDVLVAENVVGSYSQGWDERGIYIFQVFCTDAAALLFFRLFMCCWILIGWRIGAGVFGVNSSSSSSLRPVCL